MLIQQMMGMRREERGEDRRAQLLNLLTASKGQELDAMTSMINAMVQSQPGSGDLPRRAGPPSSIVGMLRR